MSKDTSGEPVIGPAPKVWARKDQLQHASTRGGLMCAMYPNTDRRADLEPLYDQAALDSAVAKERERCAVIVERADGWVGVREVAAEIRKG